MRIKVSRNQLVRRISAWRPALARITSRARLSHSATTLAAICFFTTQGLPAELQLEGSAGPALTAREWVFGSFRETQGSSIGASLADLVIRGALVVLVDGQTQRLVNRSVAMFVNSIEAFHSAFAAPPVGTEAGPPCWLQFNTPDGYWSLRVGKFRGDWMARIALRCRFLFQSRRGGRGRLLGWS